MVAELLYNPAKHCMPGEDHMLPGEPSTAERTDLGDGTKFLHRVAMQSLAECTLSGALQFT